MHWHLKIRKQQNKSKITIEKILQSNTIWNIFVPTKFLNQKCEVSVMLLGYC